MRDPDEQTLFDFAAKLVEGHEGRRAVMYKCSAGYNTVGVGHNMDAVPLSNRAIDVILQDDLAMVEAALNQALPWWRSEGWVRRAALIDLCFNLGISRLLGFRNTLAAWERGDYAAAAAGLTDSKWFQQVGRRGPRIVQMVRDGTTPA